MRALSLAVLWALASCSQSAGDPDADAIDDASVQSDAAGDASVRKDAEAIDAEPEEDAAIDGGDDTGTMLPDCVEPPGAIRATSAIQAALDTANAGDTVVVPAGTYRELVVFPRSGAIGAPITLMAACGATVLIDGTGLGEGDGEPALITVLDQSHLVIRGFELANLTGANGNFPAGIWVRGTAKDIAIEKNRIHGIRAENGGDNTGAHGIAVYGTSADPSEDVRITENEVFDLVLGHSEALVINGNVRRFEVAKNIIHDVDNIAFDFIGFEADVCTACSQEDTIADDVNRARDGLVASNQAYRMTTEGNPSYGSEKSAACYYVDGGADIVIEKNIARECDLGVELASEHFGKSTARVIVRSNFIYANDVTGIATGGYDSGEGPGGGSAVDCAIVNNTIFDSARNGWANTGVLLQNRNQNNVYKNNIIVASPGTSVASDGGALNLDNVFDTNLYFMGQLDGIEAGAGSMVVDPELVDPISGDLHLRDGSPAIGRGEALPESGTEDIDGDPRGGNAIDIGADERD